MEPGRIISKRDYQWQLRNGWIPNEDYVFISYSSRDWDKVYPCVMALRARGINVYIDIEFMENQSSSWLKNFQERLFRDSGCKGIVTFLSINYMRSYACLVEQMANRTNRMRRHAGKQLPVFYIALDPELTTLQQMATYIYSDEIRRESTKERVEISPPEYTVLQKFILDSNFSAYRDADSVQELLDDIHDKHDVVINMYDLIFSTMKDMPNFQLFDDVEKCAQLLTDNFINDKNNSIKLTVLEELKRETSQKIGQAAPEIPFVLEETVPNPASQGTSSAAEEIETFDSLSVREQVFPTRTAQEFAAWEALSANKQVIPNHAAGEIPSPKKQSAPNRFAPKASLFKDLNIKGKQEPPSQQTVICRSCGGVNGSGSKFCSKCGAPLSAARLCRQCGAPLRPGKKFCAKCGMKID